MCREIDSMVLTSLSNQQLLALVSLLSVSERVKKNTMIKKYHDAERK
jgi:hypothetical protein